MGCWGRATVAPQCNGSHRRVLDALVHSRTQEKVPMRHPISVQGNKFAAGGTNRREFIKIITMAAASVGLTSSAATKLAMPVTISYQFLKRVIAATPDGEHIRGRKGALP